MSWSWRYEKADGTEVLDPAGEAAAPEGFPAQADAETWIGEHWRPLLDAGVDQVSLLEDGRVVYGPMSLHPVE
jgi:hypothetical protein